MKKIFQKEDGLTLVEILAAITILGIIFIGFLSIFPRMTEINSQTEMKLETMNLARVELNEWKKEDFKEELVQSLEENTYKVVEREAHNYTVFSKVEDGYQYVITHYDQAELEIEDKSNPDNLIASKPTELFKIHIEIKEADKVISETFGYVTFGVVGTDIAEYIP